MVIIIVKTIEMTKLSSMWIGGEPLKYTVYVSTFLL